MRKTLKKLKKLYMDFDTEGAKLLNTSTTSTPVGLVVADHHHDEEQDVYCLVIGHAVEHATPQTDDHGVLVLDGDEPVVHTVTDIEIMGDVVWAAEDERWKDKTPEEIAAEQRADVQAALEAREAEARSLARRRVSARTPMPGIGETL